MGRHAHHLHFDSGKRVQENVTHRDPARIAVCGDDYFMANFSPDENKVTCPKCSSILGQRRIDTWNADPANKKLAIERVSDAKSYVKGGYAGYRYAYKALYGGEHVGYILMDGGYSSTHWLLRAIGLEDDETEKPGNTIDNSDIKQLDGKEPTRFDYNNHEFNCKERALLRVPALLDVKKLRTKAQTISDRTKHRARMAQIEADERAAEEVAKNELEAALAGLREIRGVNSLSDEARAGLEFAIKRLETVE